MTLLQKSKAWLVQYRATIAYVALCAVAITASLSAVKNHNDIGALQHPNAEQRQKNRDQFIRELTPQQKRVLSGAASSSSRAQALARRRGRRHVAALRRQQRLRRQSGHPTPRRPSAPRRTAPGTKPQSGGSGSGGGGGGGGSQPLIKIPLPNPVLPGLPTLPLPKDVQIPPPQLRAPDVPNVAVPR